MFKLVVLQVKEREQNRNAANTPKRFLYDAMLGLKKFFANFQELSFFSVKQENKFFNFSKYFYFKSFSD